MWMGMLPAWDASAGKYLVRYTKRNGKLKQPGGSSPQSSSTSRSVAMSALIRASPSSCAEIATCGAEQVTELAREVGDNAGVADIFVVLVLVPEQDAERGCAHHKLHGHVEAVRLVFYPRDRHAQRGGRDASRTGRRG